MRIVFLNPIGTLGGAERVLLTAVAGLRRTIPGARLTVLAASDGPLLQRVRDLGAEAETVPMPSYLAGLGDSKIQGAGVMGLLRRGAASAGAAWAYTSRLRNRLARLAPDLIHSNGLKMHLFAALARPPGTPVVWHLHDFYGLRPIVPWLLRPARRGVAAVAISQAVADDARRVLRGLKVEVILNAVDTAVYCPQAGPSDQLDDLAGLPRAAAGTIRIGLVATYALWKGHGVFLGAAAVLAQEPGLPHLRFYIVGGPVYRTKAQQTEEHLRRLVTELGLEGKVGFIGFQQETAPVYRALDVVIHASTQPEPFGLTIVEAMACGRAVVAVPAGGAGELFTPGHDALATPANDIRALVDAVRRLVVDPAMRDRLGENARQTALRRFNANRYGPQLLAFYRLVLRHSCRKAGEC